MPGLYDNIHAKRERIKDGSGVLPGKTIFFCSTKAHARRIEEIFDKLYPQHHGELALGVADDGPGVPPEELPRLAERFYRGSDARAEGSGLGLAIAQGIAHLHQARLELENLPGGGFEARLRWYPSPAT